MEKDLLEIINHYGVLYQLEYYQTEVWELDNAIQEYENFNNYLPKDAVSIEVDGNVFTIPKYAKHLRKHIAEELSDNFVMLYQFKEYYKLNFELVKDFITFDSNPLRYSKIFFKDVHKLGRKIIEIESLGENIIEMDRFMLKGLLQMVLYELKQFQVYYGITDEEIEEVMIFKIERQKERMKNESNWFIK